MSRTTITAVFAAALVAGVAGPVAHADVSRGVISAFHGQLVISKDELPEGKSDKESISKIKAATLTTIEGSKNDDVTFWHFHYTAFLAKAGSAKLTLQFLKDGKLAANQQLDGIDPKSNVLSGDISINEDEGLNRGKTYTVVLVSPGQAVVAKAQLTVK
jgi:hypothetical protein